MDKITLKHVILYAKHWYERTDIVEDLKKCLTADNYSGEWFDKTDVMNVLLNQYEKLPIKGTRSLSNFVNEIKEVNCWKTGYYTKNHAWVKKNTPENELPDYDVDIACIYYCLSEFSHLTNTEWVAVKPDYKKVLPKRKGLKMADVDKMFKNV